DALAITPAEAAAIAFWVALPWSTKMVAGVASDVYPIFGSRRAAYLLLGALLSFVGYAWLATTVSTRATYLAAMVVITVGFMIQDVVADALSVEVARSEEEMKQIQALGRMALLAGTISVGYLSGWLAAALDPREVFAIALVLPVLVAVAAGFIPRDPARAVAPSDEANPLGAGKARLVVLVGLGYAALGVVLEALSVPFGQEIGAGRLGHGHRPAAAAHRHLPERGRRGLCHLLLPRDARRGAGVQLLGDRPSGLRPGVPGRARAGHLRVEPGRPRGLPQADHPAAGALHPLLGHGGGLGPVPAHHRALLRGLRVVRAGPACVRVHRHHDLGAARPAQHGAHARGDRPHRAARRGGHHVRDHGLAHEPRAVGQR